MFKLTNMRLFFENIFVRLGLGMRAKLILLFVVIKVLPLVLLALVAWSQSLNLAEELSEQTEDMGKQLHLQTQSLSKITIEALQETGKIAVNDAVTALDERARENIERMTTDTAKAVAQFLYARDSDILLVAGLEPSVETYKKFVQTRFAHVTQTHEWVLSDSGTWQPAQVRPPAMRLISSIPENDLNFHYRAPDGFISTPLPLYREMTFVDLTGQEIFKVSSQPNADTTLRNVSDRKNTFAMAETYFDSLLALQAGEIYVSEVIGSYVPSRVIGVYNKANANKVGEDFAPEKSAYAGRENPLGKRFEGVVRWATPVVQKGKIVGFVTLALDHRHLMEFTEHITPTDERYTEIADASEGNYAFIWDSKGRSIVHPRHFSIAGYNPETGEPEIPWLEDRIYDDWQASGKEYADFIQDVPTFANQSTERKPAAALTKQGKIGLDCRYLNFAPQCTGWFDLTKEGGSGSFDILWSGLHKLTTAAAIPYYTGQYANSERGFGFVTIGSGLDHFHEPAVATKKVIDGLIIASDVKIDTLVDATEAQLNDTKVEAQKSIADNLIQTASRLGISTAVMVVLVIIVAIWIASAFTKSITTLIKGISRFHRGERHFRFRAPVKNELGTLADSFDAMADSLVNSIKGPLVLTDMEHKIIYVNDVALAIRNERLENVIGKVYAEYSIFPPMSKYCPIRALHEGTEAEMIYFEPNKHYYRGSGSYFFDQNGEKLGYLIQTSDVTEIAIEKKKIEEQRAVLDTIFTSSPDIIWYKDNTGKYLAVNPRFVQLLNLPISEIVGHTFKELFNAEALQIYSKSEKAVYATREAVYAVESLTFADGHVEIVDSVRTPIFNTAGEIVGILGVSRNVTERVATEEKLKETQIELQKTAAEAKRASVAKSDFLARMSHEIRTPMNAIIGMAQISLRKLLEPNPSLGELQGHIRQIAISSQHLLGLLNDILDIPKIEAGKIELLEEVFEMPKLVNNVASIIKPRCQEKNIVFDIGIADVTAKAFVSDSLRLRQVLINLLGNAVKFTPKGGTVHMQITKKEENEHQTLMKFSVTDTGIGMSPEVLAGLFTPFEQGNAQITREFGGTGLGLSISRSIVNLLGGDIDVKSELGKGSEFSFTLWLKNAEKLVQEQISQSGSVCLSGRKVLLVDDIDINRIIVVEQLSSTGLIIEEASDGQEAIDKFKASPENYYDVILMDVQMPKVNGYDATKYIRSLGRSDSRSVPIIAMTANAFKEDIDAAMLSGMNAHLAKPLEIDKLMTILQTYLGCVEQVDDL